MHIFITKSRSLLPESLLESIKGEIDIIEKNVFDMDRLSLFESDVRTLPTTVKIIGVGDVYGSEARFTANFLNTTFPSFEAKAGQFDPKSLNESNPFNRSIEQSKSEVLSAKIMFVERFISMTKSLEVNEDKLRQVYSLSTRNVSLSGSNPRSIIMEISRPDVIRNYLISEQVGYIITKTKKNVSCDVTRNCMLLRECVAIADDIIKENISLTDNREKFKEFIIKNSPKIRTMMLNKILEAYSGINTQGKMYYLGAELFYK